MKLGRCKYPEIGGPARIGHQPLAARKTGTRAGAEGRDPSSAVAKCAPTGRESAEMSERASETELRPVGDSRRVLPCD